GTTGDPATPLEATRKMAKALEQGVLLIVDAQQHTGYGANKCVVDAVDDYLINRTVPADETLCKS
ncbi:MAG: alpha/beta hydrolase, partial [Ilumatobacteraceae bacterium]